MKIKEEFLLDNLSITKNLPTIGRVTCKPALIHSDDYSKWADLGFKDIFEEVIEEVIETVFEAIVDKIEDIVDNVRDKKKKKL